MPLNSTKSESWARRMRDRNVHHARNNYLLDWTKKTADLYLSDTGMSQQTRKA